MQGESNSISNQKEFLSNYAREHGYINLKHYTDDVFSGRNFNRPAIKELLKDVEDGKVGTVIVKDMSRFGRNYLQVGFYTEILFSKKQVRFIAVTNNVDSDSENPNQNDFAPLSYNFIRCEKCNFTKLPHNYFVLKKLCGSL